MIKTKINKCSNLLNKCLLLLSLSRSLATTSMSLSNQSCMDRPTLINLNLNVSCNAVDSLSAKYVLPVNQKT